MYTACKTKIKSEAAVARALIILDFIVLSFRFSAILLTYLWNEQNSVLTMNIKPIAQILSDPRSAGLSLFSPRTFYWWYASIYNKHSSTSLCGSDSKSTITFKSRFASSGIWLLLSMILFTIDFTIFSISLSSISSPIFPMHLYHWWQVPLNPCKHSPDFIESACLLYILQAFHISIIIYPKKNDSTVVIRKGTDCF
mgnify:CR=1 FL=1